MTVHPTEQCVQMFLRSTAWEGADPAACALRTPARGSAPRTERLPAASPERRRKERRSTTPPDWFARAAARAPRRASRSLCLMSTVCPPSAWIPVHAVIGPHVVRLFVAGLALFIVGLAIGLGGGGEGTSSGGDGASAGTQGAKDIAAIHLCAVSAPHGFLLCGPGTAQAASARASVWIVMNTRPGAPTGE